MKIRKKTIYDALPIVAAAYGEKFGVKVQVGGDTAYTNGEMINIPRIADDFDNKDVVWGYLAHEAAHVRFTEFVERPQNLYGDLLNILEDTRIEREMCRVYPGTFSTLNAVAEYMASQGHYAMLSINDHPAQIIAGYCLYYLQYHYMEQKVLLPYLQSSDAALSYVLPSQITAVLTSILDKVPSTRSTVEIVALVNEIIDLLKDTAQDDNSNTSNDQNQGNSDDTGNSQGPSDSQSDSHNTSNDQSQGNSDDTGNSQGPSDNQGQGNKAAINAALNATGNELQGDIRDRLKADLGALSVSSNTSDYHKPLEAREAKDCVAPNSYLHQQVASESARIRQQLYGLVQAKNHTAQRNERRGKRIDSKRVSRIVSGDYRLFSRPSERVQPNTAVHILVDMSSSMSNKVVDGKTYAYIAQSSALALSLALDSINGVNVAVTYFSNDITEPVTTIVKHGEKVKSKANFFTMNPAGNTPLAEGLWYAAYQLSKTKQNRKVVLVITDGQPTNPLAAHEVIQLCGDSNIELMGIGINAAPVGRYFHNSINISDVSELRTTLFSLMENILVAA